LKAFPFIRVNLKRTFIDDKVKCILNPNSYQDIDAVLDNSEYFRDIEEKV
jgi:hypothetical protein